MVVLLGLVGLVVLVAAVIAGVAGVLAWLSVLLARALRTSRWGRGLAQSRRETAAVSQDRDDLRDTPRGYTASTPGDEDTARNGSDPRLRGPSLFEHPSARRPAHPQAAPPPGALASQAPGPSPLRGLSSRPPGPPRSPPARPRTGSPVTGVITTRPAAPPESGRPGHHSTARVSLRAEPGHLTPGRRASLVDAVLNLPEVQESARVEATFRLGDDESLHRLQERCEDVSTRPAGWSALLDASPPSSRAGQHVPDSAGQEPLPGA
jgi:hypothetical protein